MKIENAQLIGIAGVARSGKDTLFECIKSWMEGFGVECAKLALAAELKNALRDPLKDLGLNVWSEDSEVKKQMRPLLVAYGGIARKATLGTHWTSRVSPIVDDCISKGVLPVVTDIRYTEYEEDELYWLRKKGGILIHVSRYDIVDGQREWVLPANEDEWRNDPILKNEADLCIDWPSTKDENGNPDMDKIKEFAYHEFGRSF